MPADLQVWTMEHTVFDSTSETFSMLHSVIAKASWVMLHSIKGQKQGATHWVMAHTISASSIRRFNMKHSVSESKSPDQSEIFEMLHSVSGAESARWPMLHTIREPMAFVTEMRHSIG